MGKRAGSELVGIVQNVLAPMFCSWGPALLLYLGFVLVAVRYAFNTSHFSTRSAHYLL
jgi:hypothetical protein